MRSLVKELLYLSISGVLIALFFSVVMFDLHNAKHNDAVVINRSNPMDHSNNKADRIYGPDKHELTNNFPGPVTSLIGATNLGNLKLRDIFLLVFVWPIGMIFNSYSIKLSNRFK